MSQADTKKIEVFISHMTTEQDVARAFKSIVEKTFLNMVEVFIASDRDNIASGSKWLDSITNSLKNCDVEIILCSHESITKPWVNFESGSGWIRGIPVIPLCHSTLDKSELKPPLSLLQSANATNEEDLKNTMETIAKALGAKLPQQLDFSEFINSVHRFNQGHHSKEVQATPNQHKTTVDKTENVEYSPYSDNIDRHVEILHLINTFAGDDRRATPYAHFIEHNNTHSKENTIDSVFYLIQNSCLCVSEKQTLNGWKQMMSITTKGKDVLNRHPNK